MVAEADFFVDKPGLSTIFCVEQQVIRLSKMSESSETPLPSLLVLLADWAPLSVDTVNAALADAFGPSPDPDSQFALPVVESVQFMVKARGSMLIVHNNPGSYFEDADAVANAIQGDDLFASAVRAHSGWMSTDIISSDDGYQEQYDTIGKLLAELAPNGGKAVALFVPDRGVLIRFDENRRMQLRGPNTLVSLGFDV